MKIVIDIPEEAYKNLLNNYSFSSEEIPIISLAIATGTPLPDNATNGDVIKALFPNITISSFNGKTETSLDKHTDFRTDWWDAPYKVKEVEE